MTNDRDRRVDEAIAEYLAACDAGNPPDQSAFLARHSDLADSLREFLADHARMRRVADPDPNQTVDSVPAPGPETVTHASEPEPADTSDRPTGPPATVRYFGDYELLAEIARGGMGVVFRARQVSLQREVALKMILSAGLASAADVQRFRLEAEAAANLDHPHVLPIYEVGEYQGQPYFGMKLVSGGSLADRLAAHPRSPVRELVGLLVKVCRAVDFAHRRGVLHRDLKPANVLLDPDGTPYVTDFGLAKKSGREDSGLTRTGAVVGTPSYMPPEQARGEKGLTTAADVYALGAILYEVLTARPPFRGPTVMDTLLQVMTQEAADPRTIDPSADRDLALVALKCLAKDPARRYESAAALADDLDRWLAGEPLSVRPLSPAAQVWRWVKRNAGAVLGSAGVGAAAGLGVGLTYGLLETQMMFGGALVPFFPAWTMRLLEASPWALGLAMIVVFLLVAFLGWAVVALTRPADRATALAAGLLAGLTAGFAAFAVYGPVQVIRSQLQLQLQQDREEIETARRYGRPAPQAPPKTFPLDLRPTREQFTGAFAGVWLGLFRTTLPFAAFGVFTAWGADHLRRTRGNRWRVLVPYLELALGALMLGLVVGFIGTYLIAEVVLSDYRPNAGLINAGLVFVFGGPLVLTALAVTGVLRGWRWWWRGLGYALWVVGMVAYFLVLLD